VIASLVFGQNLRMMGIERARYKTFVRATSSI
jgi:hypothetical protein